MFCGYCGQEIADDAAFCHKCWRPVPGNRSFAGGNAQVNAQALVIKFSERVRTNAMIWIVIGALQILLGIYVQWLLLIIGVINLVTAVTDFNYSKNVLRDPRGIVDRVKGLAVPVIVLIYNLILGGVVGAAGSVYYLVAVRGFVMENEPQFRAIENSLNHAGNVTGADAREKKGS